ncbi:MAG TPA: carboxypeptidase-like regulatory domain-containing protein [bacterium]|nr:carboxypeptidase-like regulatory domain-containing protein [bacterium]
MRSTPPVVALVLAVVLALLASPARSDTEICGTVRDVLGRAVAGAKVAANAVDPPREVITGSSGEYCLEVTFDRAGVLNLSVEHEDHEPKGIRVEIANYNPTKSSYPVELMPKELSECSGIPGAILVGRFDPPPGETDTGLSSRIRRMLQYSILTRLQENDLRAQIDADSSHLIPQFVECDQVTLSSESLAGPVVRALRAQEMIWGAAATADGGVSLDISITDTQDVFNPPFTTVCHDLNLSLPSQAAVSPLTRAAVLLGVLANLEAADQCEAAIVVSNVIRALAPEDERVGPDWEFIDERAEAIRSLCQERIPLADLVEEP